MAHAFGWPAVAPRGRSRLWLAGILALAGWFAVSVLRVDIDPVLARSCPTVNPTVTIQNGTASPASGTTATTFAFAVWFRDTTGAAPVSVRLRIAETWKVLQPSGSDYSSGVTFKGSKKLPVGTWSYWFQATYGDGQTCDHVRVDPANVTVGPVPTPKPTLKPTPKPTAAPKATPKPTPRPTARPTAAPSPRPVVEASATPSPTPSSIPAVVVVPSPAAGNDSAGGGGGGGLELAGGLLTGGSSLAVPLIALVSAILGGFLLFLTRRRRRDQPAMDAGALALEGVPLGPPPSLIPAAIFRQVLFDPMELTPIWARPRQDTEPEPAGATEEPKPAKRPRKPKATAEGTAPAKPAKPAKPATPRRPRKRDAT